MESTMSTRRVILALTALAILGCSSTSTNETTGGGGGVATGGAGGAGGTSGAGGGSASSCGNISAMDFKVVFVTKERFKGNFAQGKSSAREAADSLCAQSAAQALPGRTWHAWISTSSENAIDGLTGGPWRMVDGNLVFELSALLTSSFPQKPAWLSAECYPAPQSVWTGTSNDGTVASSTCGDWTNIATKGVRGSSGTSSGWTSSGQDECSMENRLYCFEL